MEFLENIYNEIYEVTGDLGDPKIKIGDFLEKKEKDYYLVFSFFLFNNYTFLLYNITIEKKNNKFERSNIEFRKNYLEDMIYNHYKFNTPCNVYMYEDEYEKF